MKTVPINASFGLEYAIFRYNFNVGINTEGSYPNNMVVSNNPTAPLLIFSGFGTISSQAIGFDQGQIINYNYYKTNFNGVGQGNATIAGSTISFGLTIIGDYTFMIPNPNNFNFNQQSLVVNTTLTATVI